MIPSNSKIIQLETQTKALTRKQIDNTYHYVEEILGNLSDKALSELIDGYGGDLDKLLNELLAQTSNVINFNSHTLESEKLEYLEFLEKGLDEQLKIMSYNYFKSTCLSNFTQNWRNLEWGNLVQLYHDSAYLCQRGSGKCMSPSELVLMYDGTLKEIQYIEIGDQLMGVDNTPRIVTHLHSGSDMMYEVEQKYFSNYVVNSQHLIHFEQQPIIKRLDRKGHKIDWDRNNALVQEISAEEFYNQSKSYELRSFGKRIIGWDLSEKSLLIEPYWLGLWLGDGTRTNTEIASIDEEVIEYIKGYAQRLNLRYVGCKRLIQGVSISHRIAVSNGGTKSTMRNILLDYLRFYDLYDNKYIPLEYLQGSRKQRLDLLAGLIDSDGHLIASKRQYVFTQKNRRFIEQVQRLCWSLGFRANISEHTYKTNQIKGGIATTCQLYISGAIWTIPCQVPYKKVESFTLGKPIDRCGIKVKPIGIGKYYGFTCDKDHLFILKDGTIVKNSYEFCYAFPLWRLWSYKRPHPLIQDTKDNHLRKETCIITNESRLGNLHIAKIVEEIQLNDILGEKMNPNNKANLGKEGITTETGSILHKRSAGGFIRGLHVGASITDDFLDKSNLYSTEQRGKAKEVFKAEIKNIVDQGGYNIVSGTPFHQDDLYGDLIKDPNYHVFTYPGILPNKELLAPDRFTFDFLMALKQSLGTIVFAREILVSPISDSSSLFPYEYLMRATIGMENVRYVDNIESYPIKMERVAVGCDFAISGAIGADSSAFRVWGRGVDKKIYLLHSWHKQGASHNEQISQVVSIDDRFKPNVIKMESNGFQRILADMVKQRGAKNIKEFVTTSGIKKDLYSGLPSLSAMFERGDLRVPYAPDEDTQAKTDLMFTQFNGVTFNEDSGKLENSVDHDDLCMADFMAITELREQDKIIEMFLV